MKKNVTRYINEFTIDLAAMAGCFGYLLYQTWMKWGDLIIDTFREFWIPMKLLEGRVLYRDIFYEYGLFPPYFQASLFKLFGVHLNTLVGLGIVITLLVAVAIYLICRLFLSAFVSALTVIVFFLVFAFNHSFCNNDFNFILPYSFASTLFLLFTLYAVFFFLKFIQSNRFSHLFCWALCLLMAIFCRVDLPLLVWSGFLVTGVVYAVKMPENRNIKFWLLLFLPLAAGIAGYLLFAFIFDAWGGFRECLIDHILYFQKGPFQEFIMGTDNISESLKVIGKSTLLTLFLFPLLGVCTAGVSYLIKTPRTFSRILLLLLSVLAISLAFVFLPVYFEFIQYRCLSLLLTAGVFYYAGRLLIRAAPPYALQLFCLFLTAWLLASRMLLNTGPDLYGFYLLVLGLICYHLIIFNGIMPIITRAAPAVSRQFVELIYIGFLLTLAFGYWTWSASYYDNRTARMITKKGTFHWFNDGQTKSVFLTVNWLRQNTSPADSVVVFPEGIGINFFADRENPLKYYNFMPSVLQFIGDDKLINALIDNDVDYVVVIGRDASDYGYPYFGVHYGRKLFKWIKGNYRLEQVFGAMPFKSQLFGVAIYRKI